MPRKTGEYGIKNPRGVEDWDSESREALSAGGDQPVPGPHSGPRLAQRFRPADAVAGPGIFDPAQLNPGEAERGQLALQLGARVMLGGDAVDGDLRRTFGIAGHPDARLEIGRASCRERVWQYV